MKPWEPRCDTTAALAAKWDVTADVHFPCVHLIFFYFSILSFSYISSIYGIFFCTLISFYCGVCVFLYVIWCICSYQLPAFIFCDSFLISPLLLWVITLMNCERALFSSCVREAQKVLVCQPVIFVDQSVIFWYVYVIVRTSSRQCLNT